MSLFCTGGIWRARNAAMTRKSTDVIVYASIFLILFLITCKFIFQPMHPVILAIESSCDETSASVIMNGKVLNNIIASQTVHQKYGGVVPELASRAHQQNIVSVVEEAIRTAGIQKTDLDAVALYARPGSYGRAAGGCFVCQRSGHGAQDTTD